MKKNKKQPEDAVVILEEATVRNNINLNIDQDDLVQVIVQEKLDGLEAAMLEAKKKYHNHLEGKTELEKNFMQYFPTVQKAIATEPVYKALSQVLQREKIEHNIIWKRDTAYDREELFIKHSMSSDLLETAEERKQPVSYFKSVAAKNASTLCLYKTTSVTATLVSTKINDTVKGVLSYTYSVDLRGTKAKEFDQKYIDWGKRAVQLQEEWYQATLAYLEVKYGEKKIKTQLIKASLKKSAEGKQLLEMLSNVGNMKMLQ